MRILLAEDDAAISGMVKQALCGAGYSVETSSNGPDTWEMGGTGVWAAIILDLGLPGLDGLTLLKRWRQEGNQVPVLVLTARGSWMERVDGFDAGADDYLPKPFRTEELLARLRALLRRAAPELSSAVRIGRFTHDASHQTITFDGVPVDLTPLEYRALVHLMAHAGAAVSPLDLSMQIQGRDDDGARNSIEAMIVRIRRKTAADAIMTRRGYGYFLSTAVEE